MSYQILRLTPELLERHLEALLMIDETTMGEKWERHHFMLELPGKWECSWIALDEDQPIGFVVTSIKPEGLHVHRIAVLSSCYRRGVGTSLLSFVARSAQQYQLSHVTLRVAAQNEGAVRFYDHLGFRREPGASDLLDLSIEVEKLLAP